MARKKIDELDLKPTLSDSDLTVIDTGVKSYRSSLTQIYNFFFDKLYPVGVVYTQYPNCPSPSEMGFVGTWQKIFDNEGTFFRTEGGNASAFESGSQADEFESHTHVQNAHTHIQNAHKHAHTINITGSVNFSTNTTSSNTFLRAESLAGAFGAGSSFSGDGPAGRPGSLSGLRNATFNASNGMSGSISNTTATNQNTTATNQNTGGTETRPKNRTMILWKRTA